MNNLLQWFSILSNPLVKPFRLDAITVGGETFFKVGGTSARQKNYRKFLWFELATVTPQALKYNVITYTPYEQCWESQIFFLLRKAQIRNENWIRLLRIRKCKAFAPQ